MFFKKRIKETKYNPFQITIENFNEMVLRSDKVVVLDFWAAWCSPCKVMNPIMEELANEYQGRAVIGKVNVEQQVQLAQQFEVKSIPTILVIHEGVIIEHINGIAPKPVLKRILDKFC